jgi:hypothetical protein
LAETLAGGQQYALLWFPEGLAYQDSAHPTLVSNPYPKA